MKYTVFLVSCGLLALNVHGLSTPVVPHGSEESEDQFPVEDKFIDTLVRALASEESGCSEDESTEEKDDKCEIKNKVERPGAKKDQDNDLEGQYEKGVDKILTGVKLIVVDDVPLLYRSTFRCGRRFTFKCEYTTNNGTDDDWFYGYQTVPGPAMLRTTDGINSFVSNSLVSSFASSIDQQYRQSEDNEKIISTEDILQIVQSIVDRDPDRVPEKFVCGYQVGRHVECSYDNPDDIVGPELDLNDGVKRTVNSKRFRTAVIKFAKEGSSAFPALRDSLKDKILAIL